MKKHFITILLVGIYLYASAQSSPFIHDPVAAKEGDTFYLFSTGKGINITSSKDLKNFKPEKPVFPSAPTWAVEAIPGYKGHTWAPDIIYRNGRYFLYYSVSTFGKNKSCIGVASNVTLNPDSTDYKWMDHGQLIESIPNRDLWNAIDPNIIVDENDQVWMSFGSFWDGIKMVKLNADMISIAEPQQWYSLSRRYNDGRENPVEAPFIFKKGEYYYLFVSFDYCCKGDKSTYKVVVGRSQNAFGPYHDQEGKAMAKGGGTVVIEGDSRYAGIGHNSVYTFDSIDYLFCHAYDRNAQGRAKLMIKELEWDNEWPKVK